MSGQPAPGAPAGVTFESISYPVLNEAGQTAFTGYLVGAGVDESNQSGFWSEGSGSLALVARVGSQAPGTETDVKFQYIDYQRVVLNDIGQTAFIGGLNGTGVTGENDRGVWISGPGGVSLVARGGAYAAGTTVGVTFRSGFDQLRLNNNGKTSFRSSLTGTGVSLSNRDGVWAGPSDSLNLVARDGTQAAGVPNGVNYYFFDGTMSPDLNNINQSAYWTSLAGPGIDSTNDFAIWVGTASTLTIAAREGAQAPGFAAGVNFRKVRHPSLNSSGSIAFGGSVEGPGTSAAAIWSSGLGQLKPIAVTGVPVIGVEPGATFAGYNDPILNDAGQTAFVGFLAGPGIGFGNATGIWLENGGSLALVAREGSQVPGRPAGVKFSNMGGFSLNAAGQIAFTTYISGGDQGIFATDRNGVLHLVARTGGQLEIAPGDVRAIDGFNFSSYSGNGDGRASAFNNRGQLAFGAYFSDGTGGVFVSDLVVPPQDFLAGDFNNDGVVDAADYVVYRNGADEGYTQLSYQIWRANLGAHRLGFASNSLTAVPEPATLASLAFAVAIASNCTRRRRSPTMAVGMFARSAAESILRA